MCAHISWIQCIFSLTNRLKAILIFCRQTLNSSSEGNPTHTHTHKHYVVDNLDTESSQSYAVITSCSSDEFFTFTSFPFLFFLLVNFGNCSKNNIPKLLNVINQVIQDVLQQHTAPQTHNTITHSSDWSCSETCVFFTHHIPLDLCVGGGARGRRWGLGYGCVLWVRGWSHWLSSACGWSWSQRQSLIWTKTQIFNDIRNDLILQAASCLHCSAL